MNQAKSHLTIRSSTDILDVVPTLLGFIPTESLVIIYLDTINGHTRIVMTSRMDLPIGSSEVTEGLKIIMRQAHSHDAMILVAYSVDSDLADGVLLMVLSNIIGIEIKVAISASAVGWAEVEIDEPIHRHGYSDQISVLTTNIVAAGLPQPQQTRDDLEHTIAGPGRSEASRFAALLVEGQRFDSDQLTAWLGRWTQAPPGQALDIAEAAALVVSVQDIQIRDAAWAAITCADADLHIGLWRQVARLVDGPPALPVLALLGMAAWIGGQGALANMVLDRAAATNGSSEYTLFQLLERILRTGVDPRAWGAMREALVDSTR